MRIPKGVTIDGRGVGGRFTSVESLPGLIRKVDGESAEILLALAHGELDKSIRVSDRYERKFQDDPRRYARYRADAEAVRLEWEETITRMEVALFGAEEYAHLFVEPESSFIEELIDDELADEWELGFDYNGMKGSHHDFDLNVRVRRIDGDAMDVIEARDVFSDLMRNAAVPIGYQLASIHWRRPESGTGWRGPGDEFDVMMFANPMYVHHDDERSKRIDPVERGDGLDRTPYNHGGVFRIGSVRR